MSNNNNNNFSNIGQYQKYQIQTTATNLNNNNFNNNLNNSAFTNFNFTNNFNNLNLNNINFSNNFNNINLNNNTIYKPIPLRLINLIETNSFFENDDDVESSLNDVNIDITSTNNLINPIPSNNVFNVILINTNSGEETTLEKLDNKMQDFFRRMNENDYNINLFQELVKNYKLLMKRIMVMFKDLVRNKILNPDGKTTKLKNHSSSRTNQTKIQTFNKDLKKLQETIIATLKKEAELYNINNNNIINSFNLNYRLKTNDVLEYNITPADLNTIIILDLSGIVLNEAKKTPLDSLKKSKLFSLFFKKMDALRKTYFNSKSILERTNEQEQLFNNIMTSLKSIKKPYYILGNHGLISNGRITNEKAKEKVEIFRKNLYILLKKLCFSLCTVIDPLTPIS